MSNWPGKETADITYEDWSGVLTAILIEKGYLEEQVWGNARPKYFMEVKTTTGEYSDRLYMSSRQYQLVCRTQIPPIQKLIMPDARMHFPTKSISPECLHYLPSVQPWSK
jgi:hypothetical protein